MFISQPGANEQLPNLVSFSNRASAEMFMFQYLFFSFFFFWLKPKDFDSFILFAQIKWKKKRNYHAIKPWIIRLVGCFCLTIEVQSYDDRQIKLVPIITFIAFTWNYFQMSDIVSLSILYVIHGLSLLCQRVSIQISAHHYTPYFWFV